MRAYSIHSALVCMWNVDFGSDVLTVATRGLALFWEVVRPYRHRSERQVWSHKAWPMVYNWDPVASWDLFPLSGPVRHMGSWYPAPATVFSSFPSPSWRTVSPFPTVSPQILLPESCFCQLFCKADKKRNEHSDPSFYDQLALSTLKECVHVYSNSEVILYSFIGTLWELTG